MYVQLQHLLLVVVLFMVVGCVQTTRVSSDYKLVSWVSWQPDAHPGTALHRGRRVVWGNVYTGYFYPAPPTSFAQGGMMLFVGPLPVGDDWFSDTQLFAVRGDGPPVDLNQRLLQHPIAGVDDAKEAKDVSIRHVTPTNGGFRVEFEHNGITSKRDLTWADIKGVLDEAPTSARLVHHHLGDYWLLP